MAVLLPWQLRSSLIMGSSILDTGVSEVTHDVAGQFKQLQQEGMNPVSQFTLVVGQTGPVDVSLQVIVQILVRVQFRGPPCAYALHQRETVSRDTPRISAISASVKSISQPRNARKR